MGLHRASIFPCWGVYGGVRPSMLGTGAPAGGRMLFLPPACLAYGKVAFLTAAKSSPKFLGSQHWVHSVLPGSKAVTAPAASGPSVMSSSSSGTHPRSAQGPQAPTHPAPCLPPAPLGIFPPVSALCHAPPPQYLTLSVKPPLYSPSPAPRCAAEMACRVQPEDRLAGAGGSGLLRPAGTATASHLGMGSRRAHAGGGAGEGPARSPHSSPAWRGTWTGYLVAPQTQEA